MRDNVETRTFGMSRKDLVAIDDWLEEIGARWGTDKRMMFGARLCITELAANALEHGTPVSGDDHMIVTVRSVCRRIEVEFLDSRAPFDPTVAQKGLRREPPDPADPTGRGLHLIHRYAEEFTYSHDGKHNRVGLTIKLASARRD